MIKNNLYRKYYFYLFWYSTNLLCPSRWQRSSACLSLNGLQSISWRITTLAEARLIPCPPARVDRRKTNISGSVLYLSMMPILNKQKRNDQKWYCEEKEVVNHCDVYERDACKPFSHRGGAIQPNIQVTKVFQQNLHNVKHHGELAKKHCSVPLGRRIFLFQRG